ncbi:MAG: hypothetical protein O9328_05705 [Rhodobacteraceae bacterium]|nr:hypothetical protein [Paracoccaceae bacterium]
MIDLRTKSYARAFAHVVGLWLHHLTKLKLVSIWPLMRQRFGRASGRHPDFAAEVEIKSLAAPDNAVTALADADADADSVQLYVKTHPMIESIEIGLYRPYPDPAQRERIALI